MSCGCLGVEAGERERDTERETETPLWSLWNSPHFYLSLPAAGFSLNHQTWATWAAGGGRRGRVLGKGWSGREGKATANPGRGLAGWDWVLWAS